MAKRVTIYDIAQELGISTSSVSRVLNGSALIADETAERIRATAEQMGYQKRAIRRQLERAILTIKLVLPRREQPWLQLFYDPVDLVSGLRAGMAPAQGHLVAEVLEPGLDLFPNKKGGDIDAVIFAFCKPADEIYQQLDDRGIPCLTLNRIIPDRSYITCDNSRGMRELVERLAERIPNLRPCFLKLQATPDVVKQRRRGIAEACRAVGVPFGKDQVIPIKDPTQIDARLANDIRDRGFNAAIAFNDLVGIGLLQACHEAGIAVPKDLAITGFDDSPVRRLVRPALATVSLPVRELGRLAGEWILTSVVERQDQIVQRAVPGTIINGDTIPAV